MNRRVTFTIFLLGLTIGLFTWVTACGNDDDDGAQPQADAGGDGDADGDTDGDTDTDTSADAGSVPDTACVEGGGAKGDKCDAENLCNCDNVCGFQLVFEQGGTKSSAHYCFEKCDSATGAECDATEMCVDYENKPDVCAAAGEFKVDAWEMKVFAKGVKAKDNITGLAITSSLGGEALPAANNVAGGREVAEGKAEGIYLLFSLYESKDEGGDTINDIWALELAVPTNNWVPGTYKIEDRQFTALMTHSNWKKSALKEGQAWIEAVADSGTLTITDAPPPCADATACTTAKGSLDLHLVGTKYEIVYEPKQQDPDGGTDGPDAGM